MIYSGMQAERVTRIRHEQIEHALEVAQSPPNGDGVSFVGQTTTGGTYPIAAGVVYLVIAQEINVGAAEGSVPSFVATNSTIPAVNLGTAIPPQGTYIIVSKAGSRFTFRFDG
jgi:hypothetical protein